MAQGVLMLVAMFVQLASLALAATEPVSLDAVVEANKALEAEIAGLRELQGAEPCVIRKALGPSATPQGTPPSARTAVDPAKLEAATVLILVLGDKSSMGSGFFAAPGIVATNRHVVGNHEQVAVVSKGLKQPLMGHVIATTDAEGRDYALVRVDAKQALAEPLPLCATVHKTDKVGTWGFPGVISLDDPKFKKLMDGDLSSVPEAVYSEGVVSVVHDGVRPVEILHTAVLSPGNSGGPLINAAGCVVGINTAIQEDQESYRQTNVSLGAADLAAYMRTQGIAPLVSP